MKHIIKYSGFIGESLDDESHQGEESQSEEQFWEDVYRRFEQAVGEGDLEHNDNVDIVYIGEEKYQYSDGLMKKFDQKKNKVVPQNVIDCEVYIVTVVLDEQSESYVTVDLVVEPSRKVWWKKDGKTRSTTISNDNKNPLSRPSKELMGWAYHSDLPDDEFSGSAIPDIEINKFGSKGTSLHTLLTWSLMDAGISDELIRAKAK
jgi:hypothetical protein